MVRFTYLFLHINILVYLYTCLLLLIHKPVRIELRNQNIQAADQGERPLGRYLIQTHGSEFYVRDVKSQSTTSYDLGSTTVQCTVIRKYYKPTGPS